LMTPPVGQRWRDLDRALPPLAVARTGASAYGVTPVGIGVVGCRPPERCRSRTRPRLPVYLAPRFVLERGQLLLGEKTHVHQLAAELVHEGFCGRPGGDGVCWLAQGKQ
ncbi:MAG: hypothetical protein V3U60_12000, partial [Gammaproteobacteria bacterium]